MKKIVSPREFSGSSARFGISEVLRISPRFYGYIRTCSIITKLSDMPKRRLCPHFLRGQRDNNSVQFIFSRTIVILFHNLSIINNIILDRIVVFFLAVYYILLTNNL